MYGRAMRWLLIFGPFLMNAALAVPVRYSLDTTHSRIAFYVNHLGFSNALGELKMPAGSFAFDATDWSKSSIEARIAVKTLDLGDLDWNTHVLGTDFLSVDTYPWITFLSTSLEKTDAAQGKLLGNLTIRGVTKPVALDLHLNKSGEHPMRRVQAVGFTATTTIKRSDFGIKAYLPLVGDDLDVRIEIEAFVANP